MIKTLVQIKNLSKSYIYRDSSFLVLDNIEFEVKEKQTISIIGPSGVGKSTFLNIVGLLDSFNTGEYYFDKIDVKKLNNKKKIILEIGI